MIETSKVELPPDELEAIKQQILAKRRHMLVFCCKQLWPDPNSRIVAEDLIQVATMKAIRGVSEFRGDSQLTSWLFSIVYNLVRDYQRREKSRRRINDRSLSDLIVYDLEIEEFRVVEDRLDLTGSNHLEDRIIAGLDSRKIKAAMLLLKPTRARAVELKIFEEMTFQEIADAENIPLSTAKTRYFDGIRNIKGIITGQKTSVADRHIRVKGVPSTKR